MYHWKMSQSCGLELADGAAPGNKSFKLRDYLNQARRLGVTRLLSFGGAWSNHLHALAAVGHESGFETVAIVRGDAAAEQTGTLADAQPLGMRVIIVSPSEYRRRNEFAY